MTDKSRAAKEWLIVLMPNYRIAAAPQQIKINDGDYMTDAQKHSNRFKCIGLECWS